MATLAQSFIIYLYVNLACHQDKTRVCDYDIVTGRRRIVFLSSLLSPT